MSEVETLPQYYTVNEALKILKISRAHLYKLQKQGKISWIKLGTKVFISDAEMRRVLTAGTER